MAEREPDRDGPGVLRDTPDDAPAYQDAYEWETVTPRVTTEPDRDGLVALLGMHRLHAGMNICEGWTLCDWRAVPGAGSLRAQHDAHLADVIRDHLRALLGDEGLREAVAGHECGMRDEPEGWREQYVERFGYQPGHHYPDDYASGCDGCAAAKSADSAALYALAVVADRLGLGEA